MYKLTPLNTITNKQESVIKLDNKTQIPFDPANTDYQEYLKWTKASPMNVAEEAE